MIAWMSTLLVQVEITRSLRNRHPTLSHQPHRLELELPAETPSSHSPPPVSSRHLNQMSVEPAKLTA